MPINSGENMIDGLNARQVRFCEEYVIDLNGYRASIAAGYSHSNARKQSVRNLRDPKIKAYIAKLCEVRDNEKIAQKEEVLEFLTETMRGELQEEGIYLVGRGEGVTSPELLKCQVKAKDRLQAAKLLAQRYGVLTDHIVLDGSLPVIVDDIGSINEALEDDD